MTDVAVNEPVNAARPETKEQRAWYWYDWANSAYVTTTATVLMSPYLTSVAEQAACPGLPDGRTARRTSPCSASRSRPARCGSSP